MPPHPALQATFSPWEKADRPRCPCFERPAGTAFDGLAREQSAIVYAMPQPNQLEDRSPWHMTHCDPNSAT
jgi:hypothetical protein